MTREPRSTQTQLPSNEASSTSFKRLYGTYVDGKWWCNCKPNRRLAALREVTKDTRNKGKFFWACPIFNGCNFFLFWDEAKLREGGLPTSTLPEDQPPRPKTPTLTQPKLTAYGVQLTPGRRRGSEEGDGQDLRQTQTTPSSSMKGNYPSPQEMASALRTPESAKRKRDAFVERASRAGDSSDEFSDFAVDSDDERQLINLADASAKKAESSRGKLASKGKEAYQTPEISTRTVAGLPTPSSVSRNLFPSDRSRPKSVTFDAATPSRQGQSEDHNETDADDDDDTVVGDNPQAEASFTSTASLTITGSPSVTSNTDPSAEILSLLSQHGVNASAQSTIRNLLAVSARRARGVEKSRDGLREELHKQKSRNAKLQEKIAALEDKLKMRNKSVTNLKAGLMELYEDN